MPEKSFVPFIFGNYGLIDSPEAWERVLRAWDDIQDILDESPLEAGLMSPNEGLAILARESISEKSLEALHKNVSLPFFLPEQPSSITLARWLLVNHMEDRVKGSLNWTPFRFKSSYIDEIDEIASSSPEWRRIISQLEKKTVDWKIIIANAAYLGEDDDGLPIFSHRSQYEPKLTEWTKEQKMWITEWFKTF